MREVENQWIIVGSSPGAAEFPQLRKLLPDATTMTTNRGYKLFAEEDPPDVYFLCDLLDLVPGRIENDGSDASERFKECRAAGQKLHDAGCRVVGHIRTKELRAQWNLTWFDELIIAELGSWRPWKFVPGKYTASRLSGLFSLQYAVNNGAAEIHTIGCEGYSKRGHYFDDGKDSQIAVDDDLTLGVIEPFTQAVVSACPRIEFHFHGRLEYAVTGENVAIHEELSVWKSNSSDIGGASAPTISETSRMGQQMC